MLLQIIKILIKLTWKEKIKVIKYFYTNTKNNFIDYWLGSVSVNGQNISTYEGNKLYTYSIIAGQYGKGVWFSGLDAQSIFTVIESIKEAIAHGKKFRLHVNYDDGMYQEHIFNKRLTRILLDKLVELSKKEIYKEND